MPSLQKSEWVAIATAIGEAYIGQLWRRETKDGSLLYRISKGVPGGLHGYADWQELAHRHLRYIRWPTTPTTE